MADINKTFIIADTYDFDIEQFRGTPDINLNKLICFYDELVNLKNSLSNINSNTEEELDNETV